MFANGTGTSADKTHKVPTDRHSEPSVPVRRGAHHFTVLVQYCTAALEISVLPLGPDDSFRRIVVVCSSLDEKALGGASNRW